MVETVKTVDLSDHATLMDCYLKLDAAFKKQKLRIAELEAENAELRMRAYSLLTLLPDDTTCGEVQRARAASEKNNSKDMTKMEG